VPLPMPGQITGQVVGRDGAVLPGATIIARVAGQERQAVSDANGWYRIPNLPSGRLTVTGQLAGFDAVEETIDFAQQPREIDFQLSPGAVTETVTVMADMIESRRNDRDLRQLQEAANAPSVNVMNLQRRAAGVLPVRIDVPRAGGSYRFVKPLVIDEETTVGFRYRQR
jgi:hypothetical protein